MKKGKWLPVKEILFLYLAINKIMYWFIVITDMNQDGLEDVWLVVLNRFLNQDLVLIIGIIFLYLLDKRIEFTKEKYGKIVGDIITLSIGFIVLAGVYFTYYLTMSLILAEEFSIGLFVRDFIYFLPTYALAYLTVAITIEIKHYFKRKNKEPLEVPKPVQNPEDKLAMLKVLLDDGILTKEEFNLKREKFFTTQPKANPCNP
jgi:hypothetical protein